MIEYQNYYNTPKGFHPKLLLGSLTCHFLSLNPGLFKYNGRVYKRFFHPYNLTHTNSRSCEVPILIKLVRQYSPDQVLEVGNVLRHYYPVRHEVVDLYDDGADYMADIATWRPANGKQYDLIVSCSTMEHVGRDEPDHTPGKCTKALENVISLLAPGGLLVMTWGYNDNPELEQAIDKLQATRYYMVGRDGAQHHNSWRETETCEAPPNEKVLCIIYYRQTKNMGS